MMKEVNSIIDELQTMLKPKVFEIESEEKETPYEPIDNIIFGDCVKDLCKSEFLSESISLLSWKGNAIHKEIIDPSIFTQYNNAQNVLTDKTNSRIRRNACSISSANKILL